MDMINSCVEIGTLIRERRWQLGKTQIELAFRLNITSQQIQRYEYGINQLNVETLQHFSSALKVPVSYFFRTPVRQLDEIPMVRLSRSERVMLEQFRLVRSAVMRDVITKMIEIAAENSCRPTGCKR